MDRKIIKFDDTEIKKYKFHQNKNLFRWVSDIDSNKIIVSNKLPLCKQDFRYFTGYQDHNKKLDLYANCFQKWVHREQGLMKLNVHVLW